MSNQVMELTRNQMENMVTQANSILQMYDEIVETKNEIRETKADIAHTKNELLSLYKEIKKEFEDFKNTVPLTGPQADRLYAVCTRTVAGRAWIPESAVTLNVFCAIFIILLLT